MKIKRVGSIVGCTLLAWPCWVSALPEDSSNPYAVITERNVFHLNPIPLPPPPEAPKEDLPQIKLSGFFKIGKKTRALFSSAPKKKEETWTYYNLAEGEKEGVLEVVKIDEAEGKVEVLNTGRPATLTLKEDTIESAAAAVPGAPGKQGPENHRPPLPGMPGRSFAPQGANMTRAGWPGTAPPTRQRRTSVGQ
jgi:hypothetical protein